MPRTPTGRQPGAPAKPLERKRALGNPGKRDLPARAEVVQLSAVTTAQDPPRPLGTAGRALWDRIWRAGRTWVAESDVEVVLLVCEQLDERVALRVKVLREGDWRDRSALRAIDAQVMAGLSILGFTPTDRARLGLAEVVAQSKLQEMRSRRAQREA